MLRALILAARPTIVAMKLCRVLSNRGYRVDVFGEIGSPAFASNFCHRRLVSPPLSNKDEVRRSLKTIFVRGEHDVVFLCDEEILEIIFPLLDAGSLPGLPLSSPGAIEILLSKSSTLRFADNAGVPVPKTHVPSDEAEVEGIARTLGEHLLVKGERSDGGKNVRLVTRTSELLPFYREILKRESAYGGRPAIQEFIVGQAYSVAGLFHNGQGLRVCAHRKLLTYPPAGGWTVKGITERPVALLEEAFKIFGALKYTGLGHAEFICDTRDGKFRFLELNPRVWGSIGIARHAGVDLYEPYQALARGIPVAPDLRFREKVEYHRLSGEFRFAMKRPSRLFGLLGDSFNFRLHSDFEWSDLGPQICAVSGLPWPRILATTRKSRSHEGRHGHRLNTE
jgi:carbamoylphosphate synthase large subunit